MEKELFIKVETLQNLLLEVATGGERDHVSYKKLREELLKTLIVSEKLPDFLQSNRTLDQFWQFIKKTDGSYAGRRDFLWSAFSEALNYLENFNSTPAEELISAKVALISKGFIKNEWAKALSRKIEDPEGAITSSRTLIETVCKHILDELEVDYDNSMDLPKLYKLTAKKLNLAPDQHTEQIFKQILSGCLTVVEGLGSLRNKLSDAHGRSATSAKPQTRHAELAVNLAGTMTVFLFETYENHKSG